MNEILEDAAIFLVVAAALIMGLMILIVVGTILLNASLTWGWVAFAAGLAFAVWGVLKIPAGRNENAPPHQHH